MSDQTAEGAASPLPPKIEVDRHHALTTVRAAIETVHGVVPVPSGVLGFRSNDPYPISLDIGRSSVSVRISVGMQYPNNLVEMTENLRSAISKSLEEDDSAPARRIDITVAHLEFTGTAK